MARPYSYDPEVALEAAMHIFWRDGYDLASLSDLQDAMGIQRGSLYKEFGSKKKLFLKAFDQYVKEFVTPGIILLTQSDGSGRDRISSFFNMIPENEKRGCLLCNSAAGAARTDSDIHQVVSVQIERLRRAFEEALITKTKDPNERRSEAERLTQIYIGKRVEIRSGA